MLGTYQLAYNGIKVRIAANKAGLAAVDPERRRRAPRAADDAGQHPRCAAHRRAGRVGRAQRLPRRGHQDRRHRHRHRLHARRLRWRRHRAGVHRRARARDRSRPTRRCSARTRPKVKGGTDLVGDSYNADPTSADFQPVPHPDPNPLDCNGHGTHVAGTAAGFGVLANGNTYTGPYNDTTVSGNSWLVGPGVAPKADLYSVRVFGCEGSTDVTVDAIEWAVDHDMDVINMSLGSPFGSADEPSAVAATNAAKDGVIVVASAGNNGQNPYLSGSPASGTGVHQRRGERPDVGLPRRDRRAVAPARSSTAINANGVPFTDGTTLPVKVLRNPNGVDLARLRSERVHGRRRDRQASSSSARGTCARVARAIFGQEAGAAAVLMVNNADVIAAVRGSDHQQPGHRPAVHRHDPVPRRDVGRRREVERRRRWHGHADQHGHRQPGLPGAGVASRRAARVPVTAGSSPTSPRRASASSPPACGTGNDFAVHLRHVDGRPRTPPAWPRWSGRRTRRGRRSSTGRPRSSTRPTRPGRPATRPASPAPGSSRRPGATQTQVVALGDTGTATLNYGFAELGQDFTKTKTVKLHNFGTTRGHVQRVHRRSTPASPHSVALGPSQVTVPAKGEATVNVDARRAGRHRRRRGGVQRRGRPDRRSRRPAAANHGVDAAGAVLPGAAGDVEHHTQHRRRHAAARPARRPPRSRTPTAPVTGTADWYAWGLSDGTDKGLGSDDVRNVGVQAFPGVLAFAIATQHRWSNAGDGRVRHRRRRERRRRSTTTTSSAPTSVRSPPARPTARWPWPCSTCAPAPAASSSSPTRRPTAARSCCR